MVWPKNKEMVAYLRSMGEAHAELKAEVNKVKQSRVNAFSFAQNSLEFEVFLKVVETGRKCWS